MVGPAGLILEGDPGIGKTTVWLDAIDVAREQGFRVLSSRPASTESVLAYASLADLLDGVDPSSWAALPAPQRQAVDRVLLRSDAGDAATDRRAVAAAFLAVLENLARESPVLVAVDDLQWVDPSSVQVLGFAARRTTGRVGVLGAARTDRATATVTWLQLPRPDRLRRITLRPMSVGVLNTIVTSRLERPFARSTMLDVHRISGGNPFYAMELARSIDDHPGAALQHLPASLTELVETRVGRTDPATAAALLAVACLASPVTGVVAAAVRTDPQTLVESLEAAEDQGIVTIDGASVRFSHPLLAKGVYSRASPADRRAMHRRLAEIVDEPELRARHLALAATSADPTTLEALDTAGEAATIRGAPAASAELLTLAIGLGGDTPQRRIRLAGHHFNAGDSERARALLEATIADIPATPLRARAKYLLGAVRMFDDSFTESAYLLSTALDEIGDDGVFRAELLVLLAFAQVNSGPAADAMASVEEAVSLAENCGLPGLLSQALGMRETLRFMAGLGVDQAILDRALELEDPRARVPIALRPTAQSALLATWTGRLVEGSDALLAIRRHCIELGQESELIFLNFHCAVTAVWRSDFPAVARAVEDTEELAPQLGGDVPRYVALVSKSLLGAHMGDVDTTRRDAQEALAAGLRSGAANLVQWPVMALGFLDVSLGNHAAALTTLDPLLRHLHTTPDATEIIAAWFLPDAVEAMIQLGRLADAEPWIDMLQRNGARVDRPWMLAVGGRCRGMLLGARGQVDAAVRCTEDALAHHDRVPMPFERARTQLLLGQLQRRQRRQDAAAKTVRQALGVFERLGTTIWAERARSQLTRANLGPRTGTQLTPSEFRVAELAANGMTNRDMAAKLFISPKTVEAHLSRIYQKFGIHSRAQLGRLMGELAE